MCVLHMVGVGVPLEYPPHTEICIYRNTDFCISVLSPLARGKLDAQEQAAGRARLIPTHVGKTQGGYGDDVYRFGLIPARAGKTDEIAARLGLTRAHPHSRGEHALPRPPACAPSGSSPLTRGTQHFVSPVIFFRRLIPARAGGNTSACQPWGGSFRAHPRSRGEHVPHWNAEEVCGGSSPLARGTPARGAPAR